MAKQRHNQKPPEPANRAPLAMLAVGALLVAGLIVWALTRTVETPATSVPSASSTITPSTDTSATLVPPIDSTVSVVPPINTVSTPPATTTPDYTAPAPTPPAPQPQGDKTAVARISAEDLNEKVKAGTVTVIDVRDAAAFAAAHVPGAIHVPMASVEANLDRIPKDKEVVTYCT